jgi:hypothetical protein
LSLFLFFQIVFVSASTFFSLFFQKPLFSFFRKILSYKFVFFAKRDTFSFCVLHFAKRYRTGLFLLFHRKHKIWSISRRRPDDGRLDCEGHKYSMPRTPGRIISILFSIAIYLASQSKSEDPPPQTPPYGGGS